MYITKKTIDNFKATGLTNEIYRGCGRFSITPDETRTVDIDYSSILTKLIQEAGRWWRRFASDLFIDWLTINKQLEDCTLESGSYLFGFRENGVDHTEFILSRYANEAGACHMYRAIWRLDIEVEEVENPNTHCVRMKLYEVSR